MNWAEDCSIHQQDLDSDTDIHHCRRVHHRLFHPHRWSCYPSSCQDSCSQACRRARLFSAIVLSTTAEEGQSLGPETFTQLSSQPFMAIENCLSVSTTSSTSSVYSQPSPAHEHDFRMLFWPNASSATSAQFRACPYSRAARGPQHPQAQCHTRERLGRPPGVLSQLGRARLKGRSYGRLSYVSE